MDFADAPDFALPLFAAVLAGGLIGLEREWRGRSAGLRTHILVSLASALLMEAAVSQGSWRFSAVPGAEIVADPTRMAHGVLTGIGFLCAGVIFRSGFSIHGLTTAASLWISAAIGLLFGAGLFALGVTGTVLTISALIALRLINRRVPARIVSDLEVLWRPEAETCEEEIDAAVRAVDPNRRGHTYELIADSGLLRRRFRIEARGDAPTRELGGSLSAIPGVVGWRIEPRDD